MDCVAEMKDENINDLDIYNPLRSPSGSLQSILLDISDDNTLLPIFNSIEVNKFIPGDDKYVRRYYITFKELDNVIINNIKTNSPHVVIYPSIKYPIYTFKQCYNLPITVKNIDSTNSYYGRVRTYNNGGYSEYIYTEESRKPTYIPENNNSPSVFQLTPTSIEIDIVLDSRITNYIIEVDSKPDFESNKLSGGRKVNDRMFYAEYVIVLPEDILNENRNMKNRKLREPLNVASYILEGLKENVIYYTRTVCYNEMGWSENGEIIEDTESTSIYI